MLRELRNVIKQKGQGIIEYALLLSFVVGIAMLLNGSNIGGAVIGVFDDVASYLGGNIRENAYVAGFKKWSSMKKSDLENEDKTARLAADQAALDNIAALFYGKTKAKILALIGYNSVDNYHFYGTTDANNDGPKGDEYGNNKYSTLLLNYVDKNTLNESGIDLSYNEVHLSNGWLQGTDANTQAKKADWTSTGTNTRYFYSDGMINNQYGSQVRAQFHLGADGKVDSVRVYAVQNRANTSGRFTQIEGLDRTFDATGAHATGTN